MKREKWKSKWRSGWQSDRGSDWRWISGVIAFSIAIIVAFSGIASAQQN